MKTTKRIMQKAFEGRETLTTRELTKRIQFVENNLSETAIRKRISRMLGSGELVGISKGVYTLSQKPAYNPRSDDFINHLNSIFMPVYPEINYCIWCSAYFYDFMVQQPTRYFYIFESDPDMVETAFNLLKDNNFNAWFQPDEEIMQLYVLDQEEPIVVKSLISRAPLMKSGKGHLPSLEKMLVDLYADKVLFSFITGVEIENVWNQALKKYRVSWPKLLNYAQRRGKRDEIKQWAKKTCNALNND